MKIDGYGNIKQAGGVKKRSGAAGVAGASGFLELLVASGADETTSNSGINEANSTLPMSGLLALQEVSIADVNRKKLVARGGEILDTLEQLRRGLLLGTLPVQVLRDISQKISIKRQENQSEFNDPKLAAILDEIELRAAVELAKLEMAQKN